MTVVYLDPENMHIETMISIVYNLEAEIFIEICFYMATILKIQYE